MNGTDLTQKMVETLFFVKNMLKSRVIRRLDITSSANKCHLYCRRINIDQYEIINQSINNNNNNKLESSLR